MFWKFLPLIFFPACVPTAVLACEPLPFSPPPHTNSRGLEHDWSEFAASSGLRRIQLAQLLSRELTAQGRPQEASDLLESERDRARFTGMDPSSIAYLEVDLAIARLRAGASEEAARIAARAEAVLAGKAFGTPAHVAALLALARSENAAARPREASAHLATADRLAQRGGHDVLRAQILEAQGNQFLVRGDGVNAKKAYEEAIALFERNGLGDDRLHAPLIGLANAEFLSGDFERAGVSFDRAVAAAAKSWGASAVQTARVRIEQARLLTATGRYADAACQARQARDSLAAGSDYDRGLASSALGFAETGMGDRDAAFESFREAARTIAKARGEDSADLPPSLMQLARISLERSDPQAAETYAHTAEEILGRQDQSSPQQAEARSLRAEALLARGETREALALATQARDIIDARGTALERSSTSLASALSEQVNNRLIYERYLDIAYRAGGSRAMQADQLFLTAQNLNRGKTSSALLRHLTQIAETSPLLQPLLEQRTDTVSLLADTIAQEDELHLAGSDESARRLSALSDQRRELGVRLDELDKRIASAAPGFAAARPDFASAADVRKALRPGEAFLMQSTTERATHLWLVKFGDPQLYYARTEVGGETLRQFTRALRDSLTYGADGLAPPFDANSAFGIYQTLLQPFSSRLAGVHTLVYSLDRQAQALPLGVLVVSDPAGQNAPEQLDFFVRHGIATAMAPSPGSFVALRHAHAASGARLPFLGIGAPVLGGSPSQQAAAMERLMTRMRVAIDPADIRALEPISNGAGQMAAMAANFESPPADLLIGPDATETRLQATALDRYRIVAFVTHGLVAGQFSHLAEPGLVMTPPDRSSASDDGLLTAGEVSKLKLKADLVILSACDSAAGDGSFNADGLSGLSRAFFAAGARSLMVSGWPLKPQAATRLTSQVLRILAEPHPPLKAEALRLAMENMLTGQVSVFREPSMWGSLFIVGDP